MQTIQKLFRYQTSRIFLVVVYSLTLFMGAGSIQAKGQAGYIRQVRVIEAEKSGLTSPVGISRSASDRLLLVVERGSSAVVQLGPSGHRENTLELANSIEDPFHVVYDPAGHRLLALSSNGNQLAEIQDGADGRPDVTRTAQHDLQGLGLQKAQGMAVDGDGDLFILDAAGPRLVQIKRNAAGAVAPGSAASINLRSLGLRDPQGLAFDPQTGHLHVLDGATLSLVEISQEGQAVATRDLSGMDLSQPQAVSFAPSGDQTDDPAVQNLYVADGTGSLVELSLLAPDAPELITFTSSVVRTTDMAQWSIPSPDPSGLGYVSGRNTLVMSDGEVEETVSGITHFQGANVWELNLNGSMIRTCNVSKVAPTVVEMSDEPTGIAWNPNNGHYYFSDDSSRMVYDLNPGADGWCGSADDTYTSFLTTGVGIVDPEGISINPGNGNIFVVDGTNVEVYQFTASGTLVGQFDVATYGAVDPESVEYNVDTGTLLILSNRANPVIIETTTSGALLQTISYAAANARAPAGLAYAPASDGSGVKRFYIVARGIDNNNDPSIIDGLMYEMTAPQSGQPANTPTFTPTVTGTPTAGPTATFTPTATPGTGETTSLDVRVSASYDDVEEASDGSIYKTSSDLDMMIDVDKSLTNQFVGLRFNAINIPHGAEIVNATVQFAVNDANSDATTLTLQAEAIDNAPALASTSRNLSSRLRTAASVSWSVPAWSVVNEAGPAELSPNLAPVVQEVINRAGWSSGNSLVILVSGSGKRVARSWDASAALAPLLHIEYRAGAPANSPTPTFTPTATATATFTPTATSTATNTPVNSPTPTSTFTTTPLPTGTFTATPTATQTPTSTSTATPTATQTPTSTFTATPTATQTPTSTATQTPTNTSTPLPDLIFADGFESGNLAAWSSSSIDGGHLSVSSAAALAGTRGLQSLIADNTGMYVNSDWPQNESHYRARFYFDPNSIVMAKNNAFYIFHGLDGSSAIIIQIEMRYYSNQYQLRARALNDGSTYLYTSWFAISDAPHPIEMEWQASSLAGANNGFLTLWIDGVPKQTVTGLDNDTRRVQSERIGAILGIDKGTRGTIYFDAFESHRNTYVGP